MEKGADALFEVEEDVAVFRKEKEGGNLRMESFPGKQGEDEDEEEEVFLDVPQGEFFSCF